MTCTQCGSGLIQQQAWLSSPPEQRASWRANGHAVVAGRACAQLLPRRYRRNSGASYEPRATRKT